MVWHRNTFIMESSDESIEVKQENEDSNSMDEENDVSMNIPWITSVVQLLVVVWLVMMVFNIARCFMQNFIEIW